jgi:hypothetical protein
MKNEIVLSSRLSPNGIEGKRFALNEDKIKCRGNLDLGSLLQVLLL